MSPPCRAGGFREAELLARSSLAFNSLGISSPEPSAWLWLTGLLPLQSHPRHGCGSAPNLGALNPPCSSCQEPPVLRGHQGAFPHGAELFPLPILVHPNPGAPLILPCTLRSMLPPGSPSLATLTLKSGFGAHSSPPFPGRPPALHEFPSHLHFSFPVPPEVQPDLQPLSP